MKRLLQRTNEVKDHPL